MFSNTILKFFKKNNFKPNFWPWLWEKNCVNELGQLHPENIMHFFKYNKFIKNSFKKMKFLKKIQFIKKYVSQATSLNK